MAPPSLCEPGSTEAERPGAIVTVDKVPSMTKPEVGIMRIQSDAVSTQSTAPVTVAEDDQTETVQTERKDDDEISSSEDDTEKIDDSEKRDDYFDDVVVPPASSSCSSRSGSILKRTSSDMFVSEKRSGWKQLPRPDMDRIRQLSCPTTEAEKKEAVERASKRVSFTSIEVRSYQQTLGENPSVSYGPPISLDWEYEEGSTLDLEDFEANRGPRRTLRQMMLNYYHRKAILMHKVGHSEQELKEAERSANRIKTQRSITRALLPCRKLEEVVQSAGRKAKRLACGCNGPAQEELA